MLKNDKKKTRRPSTPEQLAIAKRVKRALNLGKLDREIVASIIGVTVQAISEWTRFGKITKENMIALAEVCDVRLDWLMSGRGEPRNHVLSAHRIEDRVKISDKAQSVIDYLHAVARNKLLADDEFIMIEEMATRMVAARHILSAER